MVREDTNHGDRIVRWILRLPLLGLFVPALGLSSFSARMLRSLFNDKRSAASISPGSSFGFFHNVYIMNNIGDLEIQGAPLCRVP